MSKIPTYQQLMNPVLASVAEQPRKISEVVDEISDDLKLTENERSAMLPSGGQTYIANRVHWARAYLKQAGLVCNPRRGWFEITDVGRRVLKSGDKIDTKYLSQFEDFRQFQSRGGTHIEDSVESNEDEVETPDEDLESALERKNRLLSHELIGAVRSSSPKFFEQLIVDLMLAMGYGGSGNLAGRTLGQSGDRGVDGVIDQDPLGVDQVYLQAKRYDASVTVGPSEIRDFFGALNLRKAQKGVFFTTSKFSQQAVQTAGDLGSRIVLIDGTRLAELMIEHKVGVSLRSTLLVHELDEIYFSE